MILMDPERHERLFEELLDFGVLDGGDPCIPDCLVDDLMVGELVGGVGAVEGDAMQAGELGLLVGCALQQGLAEVVVLRRDLQLAKQGRRALVDRGVVADHQLGKLAHLGVLRLLQRDPGVINIDRVGGVGRVRDLQVIQAGLRARDGRAGRDHAGSEKQSLERRHGVFPVLRRASAPIPAVRVPGRLAFT